MNNFKYYKFITNVNYYPVIFSLIINKTNISLLKMYKIEVKINRNNGGIEC